MQFDSISIIDLIVVVGLVIAMLSSIYLGLNELSLNLASGLMGYLGAKHTTMSDKTIDKTNKDVL
jgi:hypothetical protein